MSETLYMILTFIAGFLLGALFFGGLWFTLKKIVNTRMSALWFLSSFVLRVGITMLGFYYISLGNWRRLLICVFGFMVARFIVIYFTKSLDEKQYTIKKEASDET